MYCFVSRSIAPVAVAIIVLALAGCGGEISEDTTPPPEGSPGAEVGLPGESVDAGQAADADREPAKAPGSLPRLVDLGKDTCIPCKMMAPILEELKLEYEGRAVVEVIDLRVNAEAANTYAIRLIPTQIFFDSNGKEVWRHEGFLPKDQIVAKFAEMGVEPLDK